MTYMCKCLLAALLWLSLAGVSHSSVVIYHFEEELRQVEGEAFTAWNGHGNTLLTVTGDTFNPATTGDAWTSLLGLGVNHHSIPNDLTWVPLSLFEATQVYLVNRNMGYEGEFLQFDFEHEFSIDLLWFRDAGPGERFGMFADGVPLDIVGMFGTDEITSIHPAGMISFPELPFADSYQVYAMPGGASWTIQNVHGLDYMHNPEPTSLLVWCVLIGVGFLCLRQIWGGYGGRVRRRR